MIAGKSRKAPAARDRAADPRRPRRAPGAPPGKALRRRAAARRGGRALANAPKILLADEPTGNLDLHTADDVFAMLTDLVRDFRVAALIATHNLDIARRMDRRVVTIERVCWKRFRSVRFISSPARSPAEFAL
jgi:lipoprotein-releasing system ATP-binding protein